MTTALITGITGQDGAYLARHLLREGAEVWGLTRGLPDERAFNLDYLGVAGQVRMVRGDVCDKDFVRGLLDDIAPDEIYHLAAQSSVARSFKDPESTFRANAQSALSILEALRLSGSRAGFYHASSSEMFGLAKTLPATELTPFFPVSPYGASKLAAHNLVGVYRAAYGVRCWSGILFNHESVLRGPGYVTKKIVSSAVAISRGSKDKLTLGNLSVRRDWGYAPRYVEAMRGMLARTEPGDFVVATGASNSLEEFVGTAFRAVGLNWREHTVQDPALMRPADLPDMYGDSSLLREKMGWNYDMSFEDLVHTLVKEEMEFPERAEVMRP